MLYDFMYLAIEYLLTDDWEDEGHKRSVWRIGKYS